MLDTNIANYLIKRHSEKLENNLLSKHPGDIFVSSITEAELLFGLKSLAKPSSQLEASVDLFLNFATVLPWDSSAAIAYAELRTDERSKGKNLSALDSLIAAHAIARDMVLVTSDRAFRKIPQLVVEDWA